ncbi:MAG: nucleoside deaminase [Leptospiraceae bacterium]|nr:nucleoside deaminase [Leptospiraceae bacterium]
MLHPSNEICRRVLDLAEDAYRNGETPIGAVVCDGTGKIVSEARNRILERKDPAAHAELLAIQEACRIIGSERLPDFTLITSLEPCIMCSGLILHARIAAVAFLSSSTRWPGLSHLLDRLGDEINHRPAWRLLTEYEKEASDMLQAFFEGRRQ